jgi:hypothetical protein
MDGRVRRVSLRLDWAVMGHDVAHLDIVDVASFVRDDYRTHGVHLNSRDKRGLTHLIVERINRGHVSSVNSFPIIVCARASPYLSSNQNTEVLNIYLMQLPLFQISQQKC